MSNNITNFTELIDPTTKLWNIEAFELKALYEADVINRKIAPVLSNSIISEDGSMIYALKLEIVSRYDANTCDIDFPYYRIKGRNSNFSKIENEYKKHLLPKSSFMTALKDIFAYLNVDKIKCQDVDNGYYYIETKENN